MHNQPDYPSNSIRRLKDIVKSLENFSNEVPEVETVVNYYIEEVIDYIQKLQEYHDYIQCSLVQTIDLISTDLNKDPDVVHFDHFIFDSYDAGLELYGVDRIRETIDGVIHQFTYFVKDKNKFALFALKQ